MARHSQRPDTRNMTCSPCKNGECTNCVDIILQAIGSGRACTCTRQDHEKETTPVASEDCALGCGNPVNRYDEGTWKEVSGWVGGPSKDSMTLRRDTGAVAHDSCVHKLKAGQDIKQDTLPGMENV